MRSARKSFPSTVCQRMSNPQNLRSALAYAASMRRRGLYGSEQNPYDHGLMLYRNLREAGGDLRGDRHGLYPWYAAMHHLNQVSTVEGYESRAWSLGIYESEMFHMYAKSESIDASLTGALMVAHARVSKKTLVASRTRNQVTRPFERFKVARSPRRGVWVLVVYDVERPRQEPEIIYHEYELTEVEIRSLRSKPGLLLPIPVMTGHQISHWHGLGIVAPRLLLRLGRFVAEEIELTAASLELNLTEALESAFMQSEMGATTQSVLSHIGNGADMEKAGAGIHAAIAKHRVTAYSGFLTSDDGQVIFGDTGKQLRIPSQAVALLAIDIAVRTVIGENFDRIAEETTKINPEWRRAADDDVVALMLSRHGLEGLFAAVAPSGSESPVLVELRRIFGERGLPSLREMLDSVGSGLPHSAPLTARLEDSLKAAMSAKVDTTLGNDMLIGEDYMAKLLKRVAAPEWDNPGKSALTLAVLMSAMPDNFVTTINETLVRTLDMSNAVLMHAGMPSENQTGVSNRTDPGLYVVASLDNYDRAARRLLTTAADTLEPTGLKDYDEVRETINLVRQKGKAAQLRASQLVICGLSPGGRTAFVQVDAAASDDPDKSVTYDPDKFFMVSCIKDTLRDGSSLAILIHRASRQTLVLRFTVAEDHRDLFLRDCVVALVSNARPEEGSGQAVVAKLEQLSERMQTLEEYAHSVNPVESSSNAPSPQLELLRKWQGVAFVPVMGTMDSAAVVIRSVSDTEVRLASRGREFTVPIGSTPLLPFEMTIPLDKSIYHVRALGIGSHLFVDVESHDQLAAVQNVNLERAARGAQPVKGELHDPFGLAQGPLSFSPVHVINNGERVRLIQAGSRLVPNNVGMAGQHGLVLSRSERNNPSVYNSGPLLAKDEWLNPFA